MLGYMTVGLLCNSVQYNSCVWALAKARFREQQQGAFQHSGSSVRSLYLSTRTTRFQRTTSSTTRLIFLISLTAGDVDAQAFRVVLRSLSPDRDLRSGPAHIRDRTLHRLARQVEANSSSTGAQRRVLHLDRAAQGPMAAAGPPAPAPVSRSNCGEPSTLPQQRNVRCGRRHTHTLGQGDDAGEGTGVVQISCRACQGRAAQ